jgi:alcohol dehydrogenase YqhD (iron-dependent ADH family)
LEKEWAIGSDTGETIEQLEYFFKHIQAPVRLSEFGLNGQHKKEIIENLLHNKASGDNITMSIKDYNNIFDLMT